MRTRYILVLICLLLAGTWVFYAQDSQLWVTNETDYSLDQNAIQQAAQPLIDKGARVAVYLVTENGSAADFLQRLQRDRLGNGLYASNNVIAVYVSLSPRYAEIRWGENYDAYLSIRADDIRENTMNPYLRERQFTNGFVQTLEEVHSAITTPIPVEIPGVGWLVLVVVASIFVIPLVESWFSGKSYSHHLGKAFHGSSGLRGGRGWGGGAGGGGGSGGGGGGGGGSSGGGY